MYLFITILEFLGLLAFYYTRNSKLTRFSQPKYVLRSQLGGGGNICGWHRIYEGRTKDKTEFIWDE